MSTPVIEGPALNASDRCDRCGAQAYVRVTMASGLRAALLPHTTARSTRTSCKQVALNHPRRQPHQLDPAGTRVHLAPELQAGRHLQLRSL